MNTLPRAVVAQILNDSQAYLALRQQWRDFMNSERRHELKAEHHLLYLALCGKDWRRGFTPATNQQKLDNGAYNGWKMFRALAWLHSPFHEALLLAPFDGVITAEMLQNLRPLLPKISAHQFKPADFTPGSYPFAAYLWEGSPVPQAEERTHG